MDISLAFDDDDCFGVELHNHLCGSAKPQIIYDAAKRKSELPPNVESLEDFLPKVTVPAQCEKLSQFLEIIMYYLPILAGDRIALEELAIDFCRQQFESKILYSEVRYTPWEFLGDNDTLWSLSYDEVMCTLLNGLEIGCKKYGIKVRSILGVSCDWNGDNDERCTKTLDLMVKYRYNSLNNKCGVVAIDIGGNEALRIRNCVIFDKTFEKAKNMGFHRTVHAGESAGAQSVKYAITNMCAERVGHGYRSAHDPEVLSIVIEKNTFKRNSYNTDLSMIHFECCPTSSICTNSVTDYKMSDHKWPKHPIRQFLKKGVHFSISTDDPQVFQTDMMQEIEIARNKLEMSWREIGDSYVRAMEAAFIDDKTEKQNLIDIITKRVNIFVEKKEKLENANSPKNWINIRAYL